ncbi:uncharacterized protein LOC134457721 [Engraulis encrasicolus]|uniref:uncharacterized protein LOC134457721 n=1 Tax=Engraulis encrasicolus TaxID=184585 RepID=UPI002FD5A55D
MVVKTALKDQWVNEGRFSIFDDTSGGLFTVIFRELTTEDSGKYICGVKRATSDKRVAVDLTVPTGWCCEQTTNVTSFSEGGTADITCPYPVGYEDQEKFFCKGEHHHDCADLISINETGVWAENERVSCFDDVTSRHVTVKIRDLTANDSGTYWCGFDRRWRPGNQYTRVSLTVGTVPPSPPSGSGLLIPVSVSVSVVIVLVAVAIAVIIIWRRKFNHNEKKGQNMTRTTTLAGTNNSRQVIATEVIYDDVPPMGLHERIGAADRSSIGARANLPSDLSNDNTHTYYNIRETTGQAQNASTCDATMPSELPVYDSVPNPDMSADSVAYVSCVFTENNGTSSGSKTVTEGKKCIYASINHQQASK